MIGDRGASFKNDLLVYRQKRDDTVVLKDKLFSRTRYGMVAAENHIMIHGGEVELSQTSRQVINTLVYVNTKTMAYQDIKLPELSLPFKKAHIAFIIGSELFFDGGMQFHDTIDGTLYALNLVNKVVRIVEFPDPTEQLCHHRCVTVNATNNWTGLLDILIQGTIGLVGRHNTPDELFRSAILACELALGQSKEMIFIFGGLNDKQRSTNNMRVYQQRNGHLVVDYSKVRGAPPLSRYDHNLAYIKEITSIIVVGGKHRMDTGEERVLGDVWLFEVTRCVWMQLEIKIEER